MSNGIDNAAAGYSAPEIDARSGAFVNDTAPGMDGSVLAMNTVPANPRDSGQSYVLATRQSGRGRSIAFAAVSGGLLALAALWSKRYWSPKRRTFAGIPLRSRRRRGLFGW